MKATPFSSNSNIQSFPLVRAIGITSAAQLRAISLVMIAIIVSNLLTYTFFNPNMWGGSGAEPLYLMDKAALFVSEPKSFEIKVRETARRLNIQPEWLMAVMYSESRLDASAVNLKGSGAVGLIQFMPATAKDLNTSTQDIGAMSHHQQLDYVYKYLDIVRQKYGNFESLTELYLAILFPKALSGDQCFTLYARPTQAYKQNSGLDEDRDGRVTVSDIDRRMQRVFPKAYIAGKNKKGVEEEATAGYVNMSGF